MADSPRSQGGVLRRFMLDVVSGARLLDQALVRVAEKVLRGVIRAVEMLLGEAVSATLLLAATLKFQGTLTLQLTGDGLVRLLVAQCTHDFVKQRMPAAGRRRGAGRRGLSSAGQRAA